MFEQTKGQKLIFIQLDEIFKIQIVLKNCRPCSLFQHLPPSPRYSVIYSFYLPHRHSLLHAITQVREPAMHRRPRLIMNM